MSEPTGVSRAREAGAEQVFIVLDLEGVSPGLLAQGLGRTHAEAAMLLRRGRYMLLCPSVQDPERAADLTRLGLNVVSLPEAAVRAASQPERVRGGDPAAGRFLMDAGGEPRQVPGEDVLLHVWGTIRRERLRPESLPRSRHDLDGGLRSYRLHSEGMLIHVHTRAHQRPLEIDAEAFEFADAQTSHVSSMLRLLRGLQTLSATAHEDRTFRFETPALGQPRPAGSGPLGAASRLLSGDLEGASARETEWLDNTRQFRFHSAWRGALERQLRG